jgi:hypothetical protein
MEDRSQWEMVAQQKGSLSTGNYAQIMKRQKFQKNFQGKIVRRNSEKEVSMRRLDIVCVSRRAME